MRDNSRAKQREREAGRKEGPSKKRWGGGQSERERGGESEVGSAVMVVGEGASRDRNQARGERALTM